MFPISLAPETFAPLIVIAFLAGVGITTLGPGGIFLTIALYAMTALPSGTIAGTAQVAFVATGLVGSVAFATSGEFTERADLSLMAIISGGSIVGALGGSLLNATVSRALFGLLLGGVASLTGALIVYRERHGFTPLARLDPGTTRGKVATAALGVLLGGLSGLLGVGGPVLAVPALVLVGVPMLTAVAVSQVQSVFIATFAALGYLAQGTIDWALASALGVPLVGGVVVGWRVAYHVEPERLKVALGVALLLVGPALAL